MKLIKNILFGAAFIAAGAAFAQQSMTDASTSGLFGTDVDDFMNVNEYHNVQPENLFAYLGYGLTGSSNITLGAAHQFKKFYLGGWFGGQLNSWSSTTGFDKDGKATIKNSTSTANAANGKVLFGINNMGILADVSFTPKTGNKYEKNDVAKTEETDNKFILKTDVKLGMNIGGKNDRVYKTWALLGLDSNVDKHEKKTDGKIASPTDKTETSKYTIKLCAGTYFDYLKKDALTYSFGIGLNTGWDINVKETSEKVTEHGVFEGRMTFSPDWTLTYEPNSKFAFKTKLGFEEVTVKFNTGLNYTDNNGTKTYQATRAYTTGLSFKPSIALGATYQVVPEKFRFNAGATLAAPDFGWTFAKTDTRNTSSGSVDSSSFGVAWNFNTNTGKITTFSGFTWTPTKNVTVDANWNLLTNLFNNFRSRLSEGDTTSIWNTANKILVHNFGFLVSVKL